jgi:uncharacterized membrane protein
LTLALASGKPNRIAFRIRPMIAAQSSGPPRSRKHAAGVVHGLRRRPRLLICAVLAVVIYFVTPAHLRPATRGLIAWNLATWTFLALTFTMMARDTRDSIRRHASREEENPWIVLSLGILAATAAMAAIVWELGPMKDLAGWRRAEHVALVASTIFSAWTFIHAMFALHYAGEYYARSRDPYGDIVRGGLKFPDDDNPGWIEFLYQAFVIGCSCATSDVNVTTPTMRGACFVQSIVGFFFNTIILALTINIGASFF